MLPIIRDIQKLAVTFSLALMVGWLFFSINMPAPYLMGSLFGVWAIGGLFPRIHPFLGVARWVHVPVILGLGVLIGATFTADISTNIQTLEHNSYYHDRGNSGCHSHWVYVFNQSAGV